MAFIQKLLQDIRASYWFVPSVMMVAALLLAVGTELLDRNPDYLPFSLNRALLTSHADAVRSLLSVIAQSVITVTGVLFSMTIVAVSFASANFGPRLIGNFMRDRGTQFSLGILISTFVYALTILRSVQDFGSDGAAFVPLLSVAVALLLTLVSVVVMIYFIHHVPEMINLENLCHDLGHKLRSELIRLSDQGGDTGDREDFTDTWLEAAEINEAETVVPKSAGYVQTVNLRQLRKLASDKDLYLDVIAMPGAFAHPQRPILRAWAEEPLSDDLIDDLQGCFATGAGKTGNQNVMFLAQQLVEIIARALSPSVNDPYTARTCLNWLHASLRELAATEILDIRRPPGRVHTPPLTFLGLLKIAHEDSREYILGDEFVRAHALELLRELADSLPQGPRLDAVTREIEQLTK